MPRNDSEGRGGAFLSSAGRRSATYRRVRNQAVKPVHSYVFEPFSHKTLERYFVKQGIALSSLIYGSKIYIQKDKQVKLKKEQPLIYNLIMGSPIGDMTNVFRADSLALFILTEQQRALEYENSFFDDISLLPFPPYVPSDFFSELEKAIDKSCDSIGDSEEKYLRDGYLIFKKSIEILKEKVYHTLFLFLKTTKLSTQEERHRRVRAAFYDFLNFIRKNEKLTFFCEKLILDNILDDISKKIFDSIKLEKSDDDAYLSSENMEKIKGFFSSYEDLFFSIKQEGDKILFAPAMFGSVFSKNNISLLSTSPTDILLNFIPLLKQEDFTDDTAKNNVWKATYTIDDMNRLFFFKRYNSMKVHRVLPENMKKYDEKVYHFIENIFGDNQEISLENKTEGMNIATEMIEIITKEISLVFEKMEEDISDALMSIFKKEKFYILDKKEQVFMLLSIVRNIGTKHSVYFPNITDEFYKKISNKIILEKSVGLLNKTFSIYMKKADRTMTTKRKRRNENREKQSASDEGIGRERNLERSKDKEIQQSNADDENKNPDEEAFIYDEKELEPSVTKDEKELMKEYNDYFSK